MRVLLTGAFGNVGTQTIRELLAEGHAVRAFDVASKRNERLARQLGDSIEVVWGDLRQAGDVSAAVAGCDAVIHDAAIIPPLSERSPELTESVNVEGTRNVVTACEAQARRPRLVFASSISLYGPCQEKPPPRRADEPIAPSDHYTRSKARCEEMIRDSKLDWVILRLGAVIPLELERSGEADWEEFFGVAPDNRLEYVHPGDVGLAQTRALECDEALAKVLLIGGGPGGRIRMRELKAALFEAVGIGALPDSLFGDRPFYTDWMDTDESQRLLRYQRVDFAAYRRDLHRRMRRTRLLVRPLRWPIRRWLERKSPYLRSGRTTGVHSEPADRG